MFKLNTARSYTYPVALTVYDEAGKEHTGKFTAKFKVVAQDKLREMPADTLLLDQVLVGAEGIEVPGEDGKQLEGEALLNALKNDPAASTALLTAYQESIAKKNRGRI
ncbi:hypothetical protein RN346_04500 [Halomonas sp. PAMB 3232]|uniref:hypothetical protein n=1 Tax=Halomonas sp. PAMB 3232 TaxID=3075221 RepID=UPI002898BE83|nr:hypothetical protein [Halomonas sp. PAMB 3232]WNL39822.1 hypothetical protein RN346_04500 [Halomonas sp. PAMB 3232]